MNYSIKTVDIFNQNEEQKELVLIIRLEDEDGVELTTPLFMREKFLATLLKSKGYKLDDMQDYHVLEILDKASLKGEIVEKFKGQTYKITRPGEPYREGGVDYKAKEDEIGKEITVDFDGLRVDLGSDSEGNPKTIELKLDTKTAREVRRDIAFEKSQKAIIEHQMMSE